MSLSDSIQLRLAAFAYLNDLRRASPYVTREQLKSFSFQGQPASLIASYRGIHKPGGWATVLSILSTDRPADQGGYEHLERDDGTLLQRFMNNPGAQLNAYSIAQMYRAPEEMSREWETDLTHPSLPFRLWALLRFSHSDAYAELTGQGGPTISIETVDDEIAERFREMGDGFIERVETEVLHRAIMWRGVEFLLQSQVESKAAVAALTVFIDRDKAERAVRFAERHGRDAVALKVNEATDALRGAGPDASERISAAMRELKVRFEGVEAGPPTESRAHGA